MVAGLSRDLHFATIFLILLFAGLNYVINRDERFKIDVSINFVIIILPINAIACF